MEPRENLDLKAAYGILPNSNVQLRNSFREKGNRYIIYVSSTERGHYQQSAIT